MAQSPIPKGSVVIDGAEQPVLSLEMKRRGIYKPYYHFTLILPDGRSMVYLAENYRILDRRKYDLIRAVQVPPPPATSGEGETNG